MKLPKIDEVENPLKTEYYQSIVSKPSRKYKHQKINIDWVSCEVDLIEALPQQQDLIEALTQLQKACGQKSIPNFYTFFYVRSLINLIKSLTEQKKEIIDKVQQKVKKIKEGESDWHIMMKLVALRQNVLVKMKLNKDNKNKEIFNNHIDDLRVINFQIIFKINQWKQPLDLVQEFKPIFLVENRNYLIKMINDNTQIISVLNSKKPVYQTPPNPFFLSIDGNKTNLSKQQQTQIEQCMQILAQEKAHQLKITLNPPKFVQTLQLNPSHQLKLLKEHLQSEKNNKIKNIYQSSKGLQNNKNMGQTIRFRTTSLGNRQQASPYTNKNNVYSSKLRQSAMDKMIKNKEIQQIRKLDNLSLKPQKIKKQKNKYLTKFEELKNNANKEKISDNLVESKLANVEHKIDDSAQNIMKLSTVSLKNTNKLPKTVSQIKAPKPKIKLVMEKQTIVEQTIKNFVPNKNLQMYQSMKVQKTSQSFFKPLKKIDEKQQEKQLDMKPITHYSRSVSAANIKNMKNNQALSIILKKQKKIKENRNLSQSLSNTSYSPRKTKKIDKLSPEKQQQLTESRNIRVVNHKLRQSMIRSVYENKSAHKLKNSPLNPYKTVGLKRQKSQANSINNKQIQINKDQNVKRSQVEKQLEQAKQRIKRGSIYSIYGKKQQLQRSAPKANKTIRQSNTKQKELKKSVKAETSIISKKFYDNQKKMTRKQEKLRQHNKKTEDEIKMNMSNKQKLMQKLKNKDKRIQELLEKLKKQQKSSAQEAKNTKSQQYLQLQKSKQDKKKQIQQTRQKMVLYNLQLKKKMQEQESKFIALKQEEFKIKEKEMSQKYSQQMQSIKQEFMKKNKELEQKIINEEKKQKQNQLKVMQERRKMQEIRMELQEKRLKEQLLEEILKQQQQLENIQKQRQEFSQANQIEKMRIQITEKQKMQKQALKGIEEENRKLMQMFEEMKRKNYQYQLQNQKKQLEIRKMEQESKRQLEQLKKIQAQIGMLEEQSLQNAVPFKQQTRLQQTDEKQSLQDIQQMKQRVKAEILRQILIKKQIEDQQRKQQQIQKARRIAQLQEQIRIEMKRQEEQMERIQKEQQEKYQKMKKQIQQQYQRNKLEEQKRLKEEIQKFQKEKQIAEVKQTIIKDIQKQKMSFDNEVQIQKQKENRKQGIQNDREQQKNIQIQKVEQKQQKNYDKKEQQQKQDLKKQQQQNQKQSQQQNKKKENRQQVKQQKNEQVKQQKNQQIKQQKNEQAKQQKNEQIKQQKNEQAKQQKKQKQNNKVEYNQEGQIINNERQKGTQQYMQVKQEQSPIKKLQNQNTQQNKIGRQEKEQFAQKANKKIEQNSQKQREQPQKNILENTQKGQLNLKQDNQQFKNVQQVKPKKQLNSVKQNSDQILNKYQNLQPYLTKSKQLYIKDTQISDFLTSFYASLGPQVKQMLPYSKSQLQKIMMNASSYKKIDIYDTQTIGWLQASLQKSTQRYTMIGQLGAIENIVKKYGAVQIQMVYIFNKTSPYQKQFLAKQIKIFQKIGYIFQKKLKEQNIYSIKLIIKIPQQILPKRFSAPTGLLKISDQLKIDNHQQKNQISKQFATNYLLSQTLKNTLSGQQLLNFKESRKPQDLLVSAKIYEKPYNDQLIKTKEIDEGITTLQTQLNLRYIQTPAYSCFALTGSQYTSLNDDKIYICKVSETLSIVVYQNKQQEYGLDLTLDLKTKKVQKQFDLLVCIPIWKKNQIVKLCSLSSKNYTFSSKIQQNLIFGSIIRTHIQKQQFKLIGAPFVFSIFQTNSNGLLLRPLHGQVVEQKNLISNKY